MPATDPFGDVEAKPAPGPLARVQSLINTRDIETGADLLADRGTAHQWLTANDLAGGTVSDGDIADVVSVREALRALAVHNAGGPEPGSTALRGLHELAARSTVRAVLSPAGTVHLEPTADTVQGRLLSLVLTVRDAQADGTWVHLKACANPDCQWAFYDRSRNHGGTWCAMSECGNKLKNRDFRARRRGRRSGGGVPDQRRRQGAQAVE